MVKLTISKRNVRMNKLTLTNNQAVSHVTTKVKQPKAGWGACKSCSCTGFIEKSKSDMICLNCQHHYSQHR